MLPQRKHGFLVGVTGFEPAASTSQMSRATNCATPRFIKLYQRRLEKSSSTVVVKYRVKPQKPRFETAKNPVFMRVFKSRGLSRSLSPKPPALPAAPHPDIYSIFLLFAWKWDKLWSNSKSTQFCVFLKCRKSAPLKAFRDFCKITEFRARHAPKLRALPTAPHPDRRY